MEYYADRFKFVILEAAWSLFTITILALMVTLVEAGEYEEGLAAVKKEDYQTAFAKWKPLAEKGMNNYKASKNLFCLIRQISHFELCLWGSYHMQ